MMSKSDAYNLKYHITPTHGLLNDPNGLAYFKVSIMFFISGIPMAPNIKTKAGVMLFPMT